MLLRSPTMNGRAAEHTYCEWTCYCAVLLWTDALRNSSTVNERADGRAAAAAEQSNYERTCYCTVLQWTDVLLRSPVVDRRATAAAAEQSCCG